MMTGRVEALHPLLPVTFHVPGQPDLTVEFVIDTGFTGFLTLPASAVNALRLPYLEEISANLANDTDVPLPVYAATILWNGSERDVRVLATGRRPLLGTGLLDGHALVVEFVEAGPVTVDGL